MADLDSFMIDYHPYHGGQNQLHFGDSQSLVYLKSGNFYDEGKKEEIVDRITKWLSQWLLANKSPSSSLVVAVAPGHLQDSQPSFLCQILHFVLSTPGFESVENGSSYLRRTKDVPKSTDGGIRSIYTHLESIEVLNPALVTGKTVCVIDDIWTSGSTLRACASKMQQAGASSTKMAAVGKTVQNIF